MNYWKFLINASVVVILITAGNRLYTEWQLHIPKEPVKAEGSAAELEEARKTYPASLTPISAFQVLEKLENPGAKGTLLYIYTSWCGYCQRVNPILEQTIAQFKPEEIQFLAISMDRFPKKLAEYQQTVGTSQRFGNYIVIPEDRTHLTQGIRFKGMSFAGGYPFIAVLDAKGTPVAEGGSGVEIESLSQVLKSLIAVPEAK